MNRPLPVTDLICAYDSSVSKVLENILTEKHGRETAGKILSSLDASGVYTFLDLLVMNKKELEAATPEKVPSSFIVGAAIDYLNGKK